MDDTAVKAEVTPEQAFGDLLENLRYDSTDAAAFYLFYSVLSSQGEIDAPFDPLRMVFEEEFRRGWEYEGSRVQEFAEGMDSQLRNCLYGTVKALEPKVSELKELERHIFSHRFGLDLNGHDAEINPESVRGLAMGRLLCPEHTVRTYLDDALATVCSYQEIVTPMMYAWLDAQEQLEQ